MQHSHVFGSDDVNQHAGIHVTNLDEAWLKCQDVRVENRKRVRIALPSDDPVRSSTPTIPVNKERVIRVAEQELSLNALDKDGLD